MGTLGRPTPQPRPEDRPRFRDRAPQDYRNPTANPYLTLHADYGPPLLTADQAWRLRGTWETTFGRKAPLQLEIGCGNGFFLTELCQRNPGHNVVGIELRYKRTVLCARKLDHAGMKNGRIARYHAAYLDDLFEPGSLSAIWVNHPDPWPKDRHEKNRLISRWFMEDVVQLLQPGGAFRLKSDFKDNVYRVPTLLDGLPLEISGISDDITTGPAPWPDDFETNYQRKFREKGEPVYAIELRRS